LFTNFFFFAVLTEVDALFSTAFGFEIVVKKRPTMEKNPTGKRE
jgi:F0F1-type ATP synthase membrane subunit c/vacuolar-type H+-ATPase subunit K